MAAIDPASYIDAAVCVECRIPQGYVWYAVLGALIKVGNGETVDLDTIVDESRCLACAIPAGYVPYAILAAVANITGGGGGGAPTNATYITQTPDATLSAEQPLSALATGLLKGTTGTGVVSIASSGVDYSLPLSGAASPEGVITASPGQPYWKTGAPQELFIKSTGVATNTGWVSVLTL